MLYEKMPPYLAEIPYGFKNFWIVSVTKANLAAQSFFDADILSITLNGGTVSVGQMRHLYDLNRDLCSLGIVGEDSILVTITGHGDTGFSFLTLLNQSVVFNGILGVTGPVVDNTDPRNPIVNHDITKADQADLAGTQADLAGTQADLADVQDDISEINTELAGLVGAMIWIGTIDLATADITQEALTDRAAELGFTTLKTGYTLVDNERNDWVYNLDSSTWVNIGYHDLSIATNTTAGLVMSSDSDMQVAVANDGTMTVNGLDEAIREKVNIGTETLTWIPLEFNAPYVSTGGNWGVKYAKDSLGNVYINGSFTNPNSPAAGDTLFTMPAGYRPQKYWEGYIVHARGYATITDMSPDGVCVIGAGAGTNPNPGGAYIIDICYKAT